MSRAVPAGFGRSLEAESILFVVTSDGLLSGILARDEAVPVCLLAAEAADPNPNSGFGSSFAFSAALLAPKENKDVGCGFSPEDAVFSVLGAGAPVTGPVVVGKGSLPNNPVEAGVDDAVTRFPKNGCVAVAVIGAEGAVLVGVVEG